MASLPETTTNHQKKNGTVSKKSIGLDLTPMVDLGFLLITFFMFSTILATPKAVKFRMPVDEPKNKTLLNKEKTLVLLADQDGNYYCYAPLQEKITLQQMTSIKMVRETILAKKNELQTKSSTLENVNIVLKLDPGSPYENLMQMLDEMTITDIAYYILDKLNPSEKEQMQVLRTKMNSPIK